MPLLPVHLPGPVFLAPSGNLDEAWRRKMRDHPHLPPSPGHVAQALAAMNVEGGVPATIDEPKSAGKSRSLLVHGRTFVLRLFPSDRGGGYLIASVDPLRLTDHHRLAAGCLQLRPLRWEILFELRQIPAGASAFWPRILAEWADCAQATAAPGEAPALTARQEAFLDTLGRLIDADEKITTETAKSAPFPYADVRPTGERRSGTHPVYEFRLAQNAQAPAQAPAEGTFVQVRGEPEQRGQVTRVEAGWATVRFDQPVDWNRIDKQGALEETPSSVVYRKQRETVTLLLTRQSSNPGLLSVIADHKAARLHPADDEPTEELDRDQLEAFRKALTVEDLLLVLGPPGTGKTRTISQIARACATGSDSGRKPQRVLITSHTHRAVDNVLDRLAAELQVIRVGNEGKVTAEGQAYLLERQAAEIRERIINQTGSFLEAYRDIDTAGRWAAELAARMERLSAATGEEAKARAALDSARREAGGSAQARLDELTAGGERAEQVLSANRARVQRLTRRRARAHARTGWPLLGVAFGALAKLWGRRLAAAWDNGVRLRAERDRIRAELTGAESELDAVTHDLPAVRAARALTADAAKRRAGCREEAVIAARACSSILSRVDTPPPVLDNKKANDSERGLPDFHSWLMRRLPLHTARARLLTDWHREASGAAEQLYTEMIRYADVVAATCIGAASRPELSSVDFDLAIVDEAGQIGAANVLVPLARARRGVLVGDHQQLPPYLDAAVESWGAGIGDPVVRDLLAKSTLELLVEGKLPRANVVQLTWQRRMPEAIADFISSAFYDGNLRTAVRREHRDALFRSPMAFVDTARVPERQRYEAPGRLREKWGQAGHVNTAEAALLTELAVHYHREGNEWAVIVPYKAQAAKIAATLRPLVGDADLVSLNVGTVDSFQGGERDVILYGFTRSNPYGNVGFLDELRRANVAFTRAKYQLVMVGDMSTLTMARDRGFRELAVSLRAYLSERGDICQYRDVRDRLAALAVPAGDA
jgi:hypothetical protein